MWPRPLRRIRLPRLRRRPETQLSQLTSSRQVFFILMDYVRPFMIEAVSPPSNQRTFGAASLGSRPDHFVTT
jgi:hypothetical protein